MMGMPIPYVDPSLWYRRTWTGRPAGDGEPAGDADAPAEPDPPACQVAVGEPQAQAPSSASAVPSAASTGANRHTCSRLMTLTMLRTQPIGHHAGQHVGCHTHDAGRSRAATPRSRSVGDEVSRAYEAAGWTPRASTVERSRSA